MSKSSVTTQRSRGSDKTTQDVVAEAGLPQDESQRIQRRADSAMAALVTDRSCMETRLETRSLPEVGVSRKRGMTENGGSSCKQTDWRGYKIPRLSVQQPKTTEQEEVEGFSDSGESKVESIGEFSDEDHSDFEDCSASFRNSSAHQSGYMSADHTLSRSEIQLGDDFYDPLAKKHQDSLGLNDKQWEFLLKYVMDPGYCPDVLADIEEGSAVPTEIKQWMNRAIDGEIVDLMRGANSKKWLKDSDAALLSVSSRLGVALGPLLKVWKGLKNFREGTVKDLCAEVEKTLVALGQANGAILFQRRKNVLSRFYRDDKKAAELVKKNEHIFQKTDSSQLLGEKFHQALYRRSKRVKNMRETRDELMNRRGRPTRGMARRPGYPVAATHTFQASRGRGSSIPRPVTTVTRAPYAQPFRGGPSTVRGRGGGRGKFQPRYVGFASFANFKRGKFSFRANQRAGVTSTSRGANRGQFSSELSKLGKNNVRPLGVTDSKGLSDRLGGGTQAVEGTACPTIFSNREKIARRGNRETSGERGSRARTRGRKTVCGVPLPSSQKRRGVTTSVQPKAIESVCSLSTFQNGRVTSGNGNGSTKRVFCKTGSEGRISSDRNGPRGKTVTKIQMGKENVSVSSMPIRSSIGTKSVHKNYETDCSDSQTSRNKNRDLFRRHDIDEYRSSRVENTCTVSDMDS